MYHLFCEPKRQLQRIHPIIVRIMAPITQAAAVCCVGWDAGAELARVTSVAPSSGVAEKHPSAAAFLRIGHSLNMHIFKLRYNKHPVACAGVMTRPLNVVLHLEHIPFVFCTNPCLSNPDCGQDAEQLSPYVPLLTSQRLFCLPPLQVSFSFPELVLMEPPST